jgi:hypothetical protein
MFRPIRMDHTNCLQVAIKTIQFKAPGTVEESTSSLSERLCHYLSPSHPRVSCLQYVFETDLGAPSRSSLSVFEPFFRVYEHESILLVFLEAPFHRHERYHEFGSETQRWSWLSDTCNTHSLSRIPVCCI